MEEDEEEEVLTRCTTLLVLYFISFMQGVYTYTPETNHVSREYGVTTTQ
jgi:hypothetical protein